MEKVRLGVIGGGRIADLNILGYLDHPACEVVSVCDIDENIARTRMREWGADRYCTDYKELLADPDVDAVEILSPHRLHHPMVIDAARAGKHISVQKPFCVSLSEADEMIAAAKEAGVKLKLFENFVFYPPYRKAKESSTRPTGRRRNSWKRARSASPCQSISSSGTAWAAGGCRLRPGCGG